MDWRTPDKLFQQLDAEFHFDLDAAASDENHKCPVYFTEKENALEQDWNFPAVFVNPPYGRHLREWVKKAYDEHKKWGGTVVMLIPARTDTSYFHDFILGKSEIRFLRGRVKFLNSMEEESMPAPFPSMVVIYGTRKGRCEGGTKKGTISPYISK